MVFELGDYTLEVRSELPIRVPTCSDYVFDDIRGLLWNHGPLVLLHHYFRCFVHFVIEWNLSCQYLPKIKQNQPADEAEAVDISIRPNHFGPVRREHLGRAPHIFDSVSIKNDGIFLDLHHVEISNQDVFVILLNLLR